MNMASLLSSVLCYTKTNLNAFSVGALINITQRYSQFRIQKRKYNKTHGNKNLGTELMNKVSEVINFSSPQYGSLCYIFGEAFQAEERERDRKDSKRVEAKRKVLGAEVRDTLFPGGGGGENEHQIVRRFPGSAHSSV
jgi:hypothetical protein